MSTRNPAEQCVVDSEGRKAAVILSWERYQQLLEDLHDLAVVAERGEGVPISSEPIALDLTADGVRRVGGTRVMLDMVTSAFNDGVTTEEIVQRYPALVLADVYSVIGYYLRRREEVDAYVQERHQAGERVRQRQESRFPNQGMCERLLARRRVLLTHKARLTPRRSVQAGGGDANCWRGVICVH